MAGATQETQHFSLRFCSICMKVKQDANTIRLQSKTSEIFMVGFN